MHREADQHFRTETHTKNRAHFVKRANQITGWGKLKTGVGNLTESGEGLKWVCTLHCSREIPNSSGTETKSPPSRHQRKDEISYNLEVKKNFPNKDSKEQKE